MYINQTNLPNTLGNQQMHSFLIMYDNLQQQWLIWGVGFPIKKQKNTRINDVTFCYFNGIIFHCFNQIKMLTTFIFVIFGFKCHCKTIWNRSLSNTNICWSWTQTIFSYFPSNKLLHPNFKNINIYICNLAFWVGW